MKIVLIVVGVLFVIFFAVYIAVFRSGECIRDMEDTRRL